MFHKNIIPPCVKFNQFFCSRWYVPQ